MCTNNSSYLFIVSYVSHPLVATTFYNVILICALLCTNLAALTAALEVQVERILYQGAELSKPNIKQQVRELAEMSQRWEMDRIGLNKPKDVTRCCRRLRV